MHYIMPGIFTLKNLKTMTLRIIITCQALNIKAILQWLNSIIPFSL